MKDMQRKAKAQERNNKNIIIIIIITIITTMMQNMSVEEDFKQEIMIIQ
ncbi:MAG: hypothetical protein ACJ702_06560 [Nitrososphaeraceae archaeon]